MLQARTIFKLDLILNIALSILQLLRLQSCGQKAFFLTEVCIKLKSGFLLPSTVPSFLIG